MNPPNKKWQINQIHQMMDPPNMKRKIKDIHQIMIDESPKYEKNNDKKCQKKSHLQPVLDSGGSGD